MDNKIFEYLDQIMDASLKFKNKMESSNQNLLIGFRGESRNFGGTSLMPTLFREIGLISKEKHLFELCSDYGLFANDKRNIDKAIETQHYLSISRMLDITFNAAVALYFACKYDIKSDGYVYVFGFPEYFSPNSNYIEEFYSNVLKEKNNQIYFKNFKVFTHCHSNERIKAQQGGFIFFPGNSFSPISEIYYKKIVIEGSDKELLLKSLDYIFNINKARLFPEKDNIADEIKLILKNNLYSNNEVTIHTEIESTFKRVQFEISNLDEQNNIQIFRFLRKERNDLVTFIDSHTLFELNTDDKAMELKSSLIKKVNKAFDFYALDYQEVE